MTWGLPRHDPLVESMTLVEFELEYLAWCIHQGRGILPDKDWMEAQEARLERISAQEMGKPLELRKVGVGVGVEVSPTEVFSTHA